MFGGYVFSLDKVTSGDAATWTGVKEEFEAGLFSYAVGLLKGNRLMKKISAEDLVQDTWLKAWNHRKTFHGSQASDLAKWLTTILKNVFLDKCRGFNLEITMPTWFDGQTSTLGTPSQIAMIAERQTRISEMLNRLGKLNQKVVMLKHINGLKFREIAELLGKNPHSVASIYRRSLLVLKSRLAESSSAS